MDRRSDAMHAWARLLMASAPEVSPMLRPSPALIAFGGFALFAFVAFFVVRDEPHRVPDGLRNDDIVHRVRIDDGPEHWRRLGFVPLTPPVRLPTDRDGADRIVVWLRVGDGPIRARQTGDGQATLVFPPGTVADRVESIGDVVVDVRGTTLVDDGGELFHVYVDEQAAPSALVGWEWKRGDDKAEARATSELLDRLRFTKRQMRGAPEPTPEQQRASLRSYERNNNCGACHVHDKPLLTSGNVVHRPTDATGFFVPLSVLRDDAPLERHRPWDANADDAFLTFQCGDGSAPAKVDARLGATDTRHFACHDGSIPSAHLDIAAALRSGDEHARDVCRSRRYLYARMDDEARAAFGSSFAECNIP